MASKEKWETIEKAIKLLECADGLLNSVPSGLSKAQP